jgi:hypothetical protein
MRGDDGKLEAYAWPGGYPIVYYCEDGGSLCPACANNENGSIAYTGDLPADCIEDKQWHIVACDVYYEGPIINCDHCNAEIESAYGDPDEEESNG